MKRIIITTIFIASSLFTAKSQPAIKFWDDGPLTFNDFQVRHISLDESPYAQPPQPMDLDGGFVGETVKGKDGNLRYSYTRYRTYMDQLNSWYDPTYATPADLRFMQGIFDIMEIARRESFGADTLSVYDARQYRQRLLTSRVTQYYQETNNGKDTERVAEYEARNAVLLDSLDAEPRYPVQVINNDGFGMDMYMGYFGELPFGRMVDYLGMGHGVSLGFDFYYRHAFLQFAINAASYGGLKQDGFYYDPEENYDWVAGKNVSGGNILIGLGYRVYDGPWVALSPMAGVALATLNQSMDRKDRNGTIVSSGMSGFRAFAGMNVNVKLFRKLSGFDYGESGLQFQVFGARTNNPALGAVWSLNFGIAYNLGAWIRQ